MSKEIKKFSDDKLLEQYCFSCIKCNHAESSEESCFKENFYQQKEIINRLSVLRATIAEKDKEIERLKEELQDQTDKANSCLATMDAAIDEYGKAEAELANLQERMKGIEEVYTRWNGRVDLENTRMAGDMWSAISKTVDIFEPCDGCSMAPVGCKGTKECVKKSRKPNRI